MYFSAEMETGTGKTYVYLRTIYELNRVYGFKKFVIVVPSVAIREGVLKNLSITHDHLQNLYGKPPTRFAVYNSGKVSGLRDFALSDAIQILVINIDSFAKDENIINRRNDKLTGERPVDFIVDIQPDVSKVVPACTGYMTDNTLLSTIPSLSLNSFTPVHLNVALLPVVLNNQE